MKNSNSVVTINSVDDCLKSEFVRLFFSKHVVQSVLPLLFVLLFSVGGFAAASTIDQIHSSTLKVDKKKQLKHNDQFKLYLPGERQQFDQQELSGIDSLVLDDIDQELWDEAELTWKNMRQVVSEIEQIWRKTERWLNAIVFNKFGDWQAFTAGEPQVMVNQQVIAEQKAVQAQFFKDIYHRLILSDQYLMHFNQHFSGIGILTLALPITHKSSHTILPPILQHETSTHKL